MKNLTASTLASALLLLTTSPILCASTDGVYAGIGLGFSSIDDFNDATTLTSGGFAGRVFGGYRFKNYLGLEVGYAQFHNESFYLHDYPEINLDYKLSALSFLGKLYLPLHDRFNVNVGLGASQMFSKVDASTYYSNDHYFESTNYTVFTGAAGAEYKITDHLAAQVDYIHYNGHDGDDTHLPVAASHLVTAGLSYLF